ncbi:MAG: DUF3375 domain-containing protein [Actinomycetota bacterium]|nr:DUF3375 domain-containing protein [Actinomycetota bacterium]
MQSVNMHHAELAFLRLNHPAWALLRADYAPLILSFLGRVFIDANAGSISASRLASELDDELFALNAHLGEGTFPRPASEYLNDWASPERGWLRKYYPPASDEPHYDLSPSVEKAMTWVRDLRTREFVGTESRLNTIFDLLRQMVYGAETDPRHRLDQLQGKRAEIDALISRAERGDIDVLDAVGQRDRYQQLTRTARELLADFREVEENFRRLDRRLREQITGWTGSKGELLDEIVGSRSSIAESDQGRSFRAFYDFLLSSERQAELTDLLHRLERIDAIEDHDARLARIHFDWIDASERTQATVRLLSDQLRRFLDDQVWVENRRVFDLLRSIESKALRVRDLSSPDVTTELDDAKLTIALPVERPLYRSARPPVLTAGPVEEGDDDFDSSILLDQVHIDQEELLRNVFTSLEARSQVALEDIVAGEPLRHGLAELIGYLSLHDPGLDVVFDEDGRAQIVWTGDHGDRIADLPSVTFTHRGSEAP